MISKALWHKEGLTGNTSDYLYPVVPVTETSVNGFMRVNKNGEVIYWNEAAHQISGIAREDIIGKNFWTEFTAVLPVNLSLFSHKIFTLNYPVHFKEFWIEKNTWFDVITYYCHNTLHVSFKCSYDATELLPQHQLRAVNDLHRFVTTVNNNCLWEWNLKKRELFWIDDSHKRLFGYPVENALIPQDFWECCLHPGDRDRILSALEQLLAEESSSLWENEYRFRKADGEYAYVHDRGYIITGKDKSLWMIGSTEDITTRKLAEIKLFESEKKLSLIARQAVNPVILTDAAQQITWVNEAFTQVTGYSLQDVVGMTTAGILHGKETDALTIRYLQQKMKALLPYDCEILYYTKTGNDCWMHVQGQALLDEKGNCEQFFAIQTDVTEKVLLEKKLLHERITKQQEITDAVITAQEFERAEIGKELHDNVNQILGATKLYIEMAKTEKTKEVFLDQACGHVLYVIEEIRKISKRLIPQSMGLIGLSESVFILIDDLAGIHPVKIKFNAGGFDSTYLYEKMKLNIFRIVQEQVNNILKHSAATSARIVLRTNRNVVSLSITDNGKGCDISERKKGVGIRNIMSRTELYHVKINIVSSPGHGYRLNILLQIAKADNLRAEV